MKDIKYVYVETFVVCVAVRGLIWGMLYLDYFHERVLVWCAEVTRGALLAQLLHSVVAQGLRC